MLNSHLPLFNLYRFDFDVSSLNKLDFCKSFETNYNFKDSNYFNHLPSFTNDVLKNSILIDKEVLDITGVTANNDDNITSDISAQLALFVKNNTTIKIPSKVEYVIRKYVSKKLLKEIHPDIDVAIELCLLFCTQLNSTYFDVKSGRNPEGWKSLRAEFLRDLLCINPMTYKRVITALEHPLTKGSILECDHKPIIGEKNHFYRLSQPYIGKGIVKYNLKTKEVKNLLNRHHYRTLSAAQKNPICVNLIRFYQDVTLPTMEQIKREANRLIKLGYTTKKGKKLVKLNKHSKSYFKNPGKISFVEDAIEIFQYLTDNGLLIPTVGGDASGGRVVDSFTLMPSWIRKMVKINGKYHVESDYTCLHPNLAINLYGGGTSNLIHVDLGLALNINVDLVKVEHLSFFNKEVWQMKQSPLYEYYELKEPKMIKAIINEKNESEFKHKVTSRRLLAKEVEIMTAVIKHLNMEGIYVGYVYDALIFHPNHARRVKEVMDSVIQQFGIKTTAKLSNKENHNSIMDALDGCKLEAGPVISLKEDEVSLNIDARAINFSIQIKQMLLERIGKGIVLNFVDANIIFGPDDVVKDKVLKINDRFNPNSNYVIQSHILDSA